MKKSLSILLAVAMVFTMFAGVAFAADKSDADLLKEAGIILGSDDGTNLDNTNWKRQDVAVLLSRLYDQEEEAKATAKGHTYADVTNPFYDGFLTWAKEEGLMQGHSEVEFGYDEEINAQQFATVLLRVIGIDDWENAVEKAVEAGIYAEALDNTALVSRAQSYTGIVNTLNTEVEEGVTLGESLGLPGWVEEAADVALTQVGAKKLAVTFSKPSGDAKFAIKRGNLDINIKETKWNDDKTVATLEVHANLPKASHTVTVTGVGEANVLTLETAVSKVTEIKFNSDKLVIDGTDAKKASVGYVVYNQFGEDVTTANLESSVAPAVQNKSLGSKKVNLTKATDFLVNETYVITLVDAATSTVASQTLTVVNPSTIGNTSLGELKNKDNKALNSKTNLTNDIFYYEVTAIDQYGNKVTDYNDIDNGTTLISSNNTRFNVEFYDLGGNNKPGIKIVPVGGNTIQAGDYSFTIVANGTGHTVITNFTVEAAAELSSFTILDPAEQLYVGEDIYVPFQALDQNGNELTKYSDINGKVSLTVAGGTAPAIGIENNPLDGTARLKLTAGTADGTLQLTSVVTGSKTHVSNLAVSVGKEAFPASITAIKDAQLKLTNGAVSELQFKNFTVVDQYGRTVAADKLKGYYLHVKHGSGTAANVVLGGNVDITDGSDKVSLTGGDNGTRSFIVELRKSDDSVVSGSEFGFTAETIKKSDIASYEVADIAKLHSSDAYTGASNYAKTLDVYGLTSNGDKVALNAADISSVQASGVSYDNVTNKVYAAETGSSTFTRTGNLVVIVKGADDVLKTITKSVEYTNEKIAAASIAPKVKVGTKEAKDGVVVLTAAEANALNGADLKSNASIKFEVKDQFGVNVASSKLTYAAASIKKASSHTGTASVTGTTLNIADAVSGNEITVTGVTDNGLVATVKIIVE